MSVIVRGMEMPESCTQCPMNLNLFFCLATPDGENGFRASGCGLVKRPGWCPLIEIPESHGRLIDADALWNDIIHRFDYCDDFLEMLENAPTVVEKE